MTTRTITAQIAELQTLAPAQLAARYEALHGRPPRIRNKAWLFRQCAFRLQEQQLGGLSDRAKTRLGELIAQIELPIGATPPPRPRPKSTARATTNASTIGTIYTREWRGQQVRIEVVENGFLTDGVVHKSLTAAVRAITNANWNPNIFLGITRRGAAS